MDRATDRELTRPARRLLVASALATLLVPPGCARLNAFRKDDPSAFGTHAAADPADPSSPTATRALYADSVRKSQSPAERSGGPSASPRLAAGDSRTERAARSRDAGTASAPLLVQLQPPVTVPALRDSGRVFEGATTPAAAEPRQATTGDDGLAADAPPAAKVNTLEGLLAESRRRLDALKTYQVKMNHQERVKGVLNPAEDVILSIRREPNAVRLEWPSGPHQGREVVFDSTARGGLMHVHMGDSRFPIPPISMPPDSPVATSNSRHPITEAGYDTILVNLERATRAQSAGDPKFGRITYQGLSGVEGLDAPAHKIVRVSPARETWVVYLDPDTMLPALVQETAADGDVLERYVFRDATFNVPELASAAAFDPDARWGKSGGLFQRLARGNASNPKDDRTR